MKLHKFKELSEQLGSVQKAMAFVGDEQIVDADGNAIDVETIQLAVAATSDEEAVADEQASAKAIAKAVQEEIRKGFQDLKPRIQVGDYNIDKKGGFRNMAEFGMAVKQLCTPGVEVTKENRDRMDLIQKQWGAQTKAPSNVSQTTSGADGGYLAPPDMQEQVWSLVYDDEDSLLARTSPRQTSKGSIEMTANESTPWGTAGIQASWAGENNQRSADKLNLNRPAIKLHTLSVFVNASDEVLEDAPQLNQLLTEDSAKAINWKASDAIVNGTGVGQPLGILNAASTVTVAKEGSQAADTILLANILKMKSRMLLQQGAIWLANSDTIPQLGALVDAGSNALYIQNVALDMPETLAGKALFFSESCDTLGDLNDIIYFNPAGYFSAVKTSGIDFASSIHLYFDYSVTSFRWNFRMGGEPVLSSAVTPNLSSNTKSYAVNLAARA